MRYEYKVGNETVTLETDDEVVAVRFRPESTRSQRAAVARRAEVRYSDRTDLMSERMAILPVPPAEQTRALRRSAAEREFIDPDVVEKVAPVFRVAGGRAVAAQRVLLALKEPEDSSRWLTDGFPGRVLHRAANARAERGACSLTLGASEDPLQVVQMLTGHPRLRYVEPAFLHTLTYLRALDVPMRHKHGGDRPDNEYALGLTRAAEARTMHTGSETVVVAVLDEGVDTRHEDLPASVAQYDAIDGDSYQEPNPWDAHGTACAGLALAKAGNGRGLTGVAAGCSLMAVRIARSPARGACWQTSSEICADGIDWAWRNGAWVLSNSWGGGAPSNRIAEAIEDARTFGRHGKGCVVVVAAGNDDDRVQFPASLPDVLTVGASNQFDEPKTSTSRDGEYWWGSNYGPEVDLVAPGVFMYTTDIMGVGGYSDGFALDANYTDTFSGTSAATPLVAGAAALVLSLAPHLKESEVRQILCQTADKVGSRRYVNGRDDRMGYGRLNVLAAVQEALKRV